MSDELLMSIISIVAQYGPAYARFISGIWEKKALPTPEEWDEAEKLISKPGADYFGLPVLQMKKA